MKFPFILTGVTCTGFFISLLGIHGWSSGQDYYVTWTSPGSSFSVIWKYWQYLTEFLTYASRPHTLLNINMTSTSSGGKTVMFWGMFWQAFFSLSWFEALLAKLPRWMENQQHSTEDSLNENDAPENSAGERRRCRGEKWKKCALVK